MGREEREGETVIGKVLSGWGREEGMMREREEGQSPWEEPGEDRRKCRGSLMGTNTIDIPDHDKGNTRTKESVTCLHNDTLT